MRYILQHVQELALDPLPALLQWQPSTGHVQLVLERVLSMRPLAAGVFSQ